MKWQVIHAITYIVAIFPFQEMSRAQKPRKNLSSPPQREALKLHLAQPLQAMGRVAMAFRMLWKNNEEMVWKNILAYRAAADQYLKSLAGVACFVSAITGSAGGQKIHPGVSYWVVLTSDQADPRAIVRCMTTSFPANIEVRLLKEPPIMQDLESMHMTLCTVMKDHSNGFFRLKLAESEALLRPDQTNCAGHVARIVSNDSALLEVARNAQTSMAQHVALDIIQY